MIDVREHHKRTVNSFWIAHVKELNNLPLGTAHNRRSQDERACPCPDYAKPWIEETMRRLGILPLDRPATH